jgi:hypothetical protein
MNRLEKLRHIADSSLGGLHANEHLKRRILAAAEGGSSPHSSRRFRPVVAIAATLAVVLAVVALNTVPPLVSADHNPPQVSSQALGSGRTGNERADLGSSTVMISSAGTVPAYRNLWASAEGGVYPLLRAEGRWYRLMSSPSSVSASILTAPIGQVEEYSSEPSLSTSTCIMSNTVPMGTPVYQVSGMASTLLAAEINGRMRLFQRVSFNGSALIGAEKLKDTLQISGHITGMELSDVGTVTDSAAAENLYSTLLGHANYESAGNVSSSQSLIIFLDNGLAVQLSVRGNRFGACGVWNCPDFIEAFRSAVGN